MGETLGSYVVTQDIGGRLQEFRRIGIEVPRPHDALVKEVQDEVINILGDTLPAADITAVPMEELADDVLSVANMLESVKAGALVVSTSHEIAHPVGGAELQINRLVDCFGQKIGIGPRPGFGLIREQVNPISHRSSDNGVVIVEDGIFSGDTIKKTVAMLNAARTSVKAVVVGINCHNTEQITDDFTTVDVYTTSRMGEIVDWVPDHDFLPFIPGSGRVLGVSFGPDVVPYFDHRGATYTYPYIKPFGDMSEWATIPEDKCNKASARFIELAKSLFQTIERQNSIKGKDVHIGDFLHTRIRTGIPIEPGHMTYPPLTSTASRFLNEIL